MRREAFGTVLTALTTLGVLTMSTDRSLRKAAGLRELGAALDVLYERAGRPPHDQLTRERAAQDESLAALEGTCLPQLSVLEAVIERLAVRVDDVEWAHRQTTAIRRLWEQAAEPCPECFTLQGGDRFCDVCGHDFLGSISHTYAACPPSAAMEIATAAGSTAAIAAGLRYGADLAKTALTQRGETRREQLRQDGETRREELRQEGENERARLDHPPSPSSDAEPSE